MRLTLDPRFRGPSRSGNGGFSCGVIAEAIGAETSGAAEVRLHAPPPLDVELELDERAGVWELRHGAELVGSGRTADLDLEVPEPPSLAEAREAVSRFAAREEHIFPECFVCGIDRGPPEALAIHPGPVPGRELVAAPWTPPADLADAEGRVRPAVVWAALDCPSYFGLDRVGIAAVLGTLRAQILEAPRAGEEHIVIGWPLAHEGRKHFAGSAAFRADGTVLAKGRALWIELRTAIEDGGVAGT